MARDEERENFPDQNDLVRAPEPGPIGLVIECQPWELGDFVRSRVDVIMPDDDPSGDGA